MTVVIPMAGHGERFRRAGYLMPKMLIRAGGRTLLEWSVDSLPLHLADRVVFVGLSEHNEAHRLEAAIRDLYGDRAELRFRWLPAVTKGQAQTVLAASEHIPADAPLLIFNIDTTFRSATLERSLLDPGNDGVLGSFQGSDPRYSFAATGADGRVTRIVEKQPISSHALTGMYYCRKAAPFMEITARAVREDRTTKGEFYVAPLLQDLVDEGHHFVLDQAQEHHVLGTPEELELFCEHLERQ